MTLSTRGQNDPRHRVSGRAPRARRPAHARVVGKLLVDRTRPSQARADQPERVDLERPRPEARAARGEGAHPVGLLAGAKFRVEPSQRHVRAVACPLQPQPCVARGLDHLLLRRRPSRGSATTSA